MGTVRWTYNQCLSLVKEDIKELNLKKLRAEWVNVDVLKNKGLDWVMDTPYDVRDGALQDLKKAYQSNFAKRKKNKDHAFDIAYRSRKKCFQESFILNNKHVKWKADNPSQFSMFSTFMKDPITSCEPLPPEVLQYDSRFIRDKIGRYFLCIPLPLVTYAKNENQVPSVIALDPGVRTFATGYSPDGEIFEIGKGDIGRIYRLCRRIDNLQSLWSQKETNARLRYRLKRAAYRIRFSIQNLISEFHRKLAKMLCENYTTILLPSFETSQMVIKRQRKIRSKTVRQMLTWKHYTFKQLLINKAREYPWVKVVIVNEAYTSKTCTNCGIINEKLGGSKIFKCKHCKMILDRDYNGARNIFLKNMSHISGCGVGSYSPSN